jgi:lysophospholipase L1-like esterase
MRQVTTLLDRLFSLVARQPARRGARAQPPRLQPALRRTNRITWSPNGTLRLRPCTWPGTTCLTIGCGHDFDAIRIGMPLAASAPAPAFDTLVACASSAWGDRFNPVGGHPLVSLQLADPVDPARRFAPEPPPVGPTGDNHFPDIPLWGWTEWTPIASAPPDPSTGLRVLMIRAYAPEGGDVVFANGQFGAYRGDDVTNHGFDVWMGGVNNGWDLTDFRAFEPAPLLVNNPVNGTPLVAVQFQTRVPGIVGLSSGDSHQSGTATNSQMNGFLLQATTLLGAAQVGRIPFGIVNDAFGGARSEEFFARTRDRLSDIQPSYVVLPSWSYNDHQPGHDPEDVDRAFFDRLEATASAVRTAGALPIFLTPFPRNREAMTEPMVRAWLIQRDRILLLGRNGEEVIDAARLLGTQELAGPDAELSGTYLPGLSNDGMHPNDAGHGRIADALVAIINRRLN